MDTSTKRNNNVTIRILYLIRHLRWHYQLFILSGGYLLGGLLSDSLDLNWYLVQFLNVHFLLFGGAYVYNSYWEKAEGTIGASNNTSYLSQWLWAASPILQMIGLFLALPLGSLFTSVYAISMLLFWLYSTPIVRWKGRPVKGMVAIGISTGVNSVLLGYLAAGHTSFNFNVSIAAVGVALLLLSLYPLSRSYRQQEDNRRGDFTFTIRYGLKGVFYFFEVAFVTGLILVAAALVQSDFWVGITFGVAGLFTGFLLRTFIKKMLFRRFDYQHVVLVKYGTSLLFAVFLLSVLILKYSGYIGI